MGNVKLAQWDGVGNVRSSPARTMGPRIGGHGEKMGPRIREDTGRGEDGSPHPRGHGKGRTREGMGPRIREDTGRGEDGSPHARTREGEKMGPRMRLTREGEGDSALCIDTFGAGA